MLESKWINRFVKLQFPNAMVLPIVGGGMQPAGWPDRFICHTLWTGFIKFKNPKTPATLLQLKTLSGLRKRGVKAFIVRRTQLEESDYEILEVGLYYVEFRCPAYELLINLVDRSIRRLYGRPEYRYRLCGK